VLAELDRCGECGRLAPVLRRGADGRPCCPACGGVRLAWRCLGCGQVARLYRAGRCAACYRDQLIARLLDSGQPPALLRPVLDGWLLADEPVSVLRYLAASPAWPLLARLLRGELPATHAALDELPTTRAVAYLRGRLVTLGVLPERDERLHLLRHTIAQTVADAHPDDRGVLRQYGRWSVLRSAQLAVADQPLGFGTARYARLRIRVAAAFCAWLRRNAPTVATLTQSHMDAWVLTHRSQPHALRAFMLWAVGHGYAPSGLEVPVAEIAESRATLDSEDRWRLINRCLQDHDLDPATRLAGCLVLLFGQPLTKITTLPLNAVAAGAGGVTLRLGQTPLLMAPPLDQMALAAHAQARKRQPGHRAWLFPGMVPGASLSAEQLGARLRQLGVPSALTARNTAWSALALEVPAVVLAEKLGVAASTAERWHAALGGDRAVYVRLLAEDDEGHGGERHRVDRLPATR
jgi:hypothetical protein